MRESKSQHLLAICLALGFGAFMETDSASAQTSRETAWTWGVWQGNSADFKRRAQAIESYGRGALYMDGCHGPILELALAEPNDFWSKQQDLDDQGTKLGWIVWGEPENTLARPVIMEGGMEGWHFNMNTDYDSQFNSLLEASSFRVCPSASAVDYRCMTITTDKLKEAIEFVCDPQKAE